MNLPPILPVTSPFLRDIYRCQIQHFQETVIRMKYRPGFCDFGVFSAPFFIKVVPVLLMWFLPLETHIRVSGRFFRPSRIEGQNFAPSFCTTYLQVYTKLRKQTASLHSPVVLMRSFYNL